MIDLHCHILPGVDDGAKNLDEAVEMAKVAECEGIKKIVATPHMFRGHYLSENYEIVQAKNKELNKALRDCQIDIEILPGAEVHISHDLIDKIKKKRKALVLNHSSYMFVEFPSEHVFSGVKEIFFELMSEGITPIIAHPERNSVFRQNPSLLFELVQMGGLVQTNSGSFTRQYGGRTEEGVFRFLDLNLIHFIASDSHSPRRVNMWLSKAVRKVAEKIGEDSALALVNENPEAVISDKEIPYFPDPIDPREKQKKIKIPIPKFFFQKK